jgi:hypothetical protein
MPSGSGHDHHAIGILCARDPFSVV